MRDLVDEFDASGVLGAALDIVLECYGCPQCGEDRVDYLTSDDGVVTCESCGAVYDLEPGREEARDAS
jgi:rubredoxin